MSERPSATGTPVVPVGTAATGIAGATVGASAAVTATFASVCCAGPVVAPIVVGLLGASGAATAASLKPYSAYLYTGALALLLFGFWSVYRTPATCVAGEAAIVAGRWAKVARLILWIGSGLWVTSVLVTIFFSR